MSSTPDDPPSRRDDTAMPTQLRPWVQAGAPPGATVVQKTNQFAPSMLFDDSGAFREKSAGVALLLSFLIPGAGQMYCGRVGKGFLMLIGSLALWAILFGWTIWIWSMIDAYVTAKDMNLRFLRHLKAGQAV